jgi:CDP-diacylglycerol--serine O-phosphatidyltransferase
MAEQAHACYIKAAMPMPIDPNNPEMRRRRFRPIPVRMLVPNFITLLAICAGLTAIRLSTEGRMELAVGAIVFAAVLDGIDGRVARMIKGQSKFGAELDSLADFVNFGVAPGLILYFWQLHELNNGGWIPLRRIISPAFRPRSARSRCCFRSILRSWARRNRRPC